MILTISDLQTYTGDNNTNTLDSMYLASAQSIVEDYLGYAVEHDDYFFDDTIKSDFVELDAPVDTIETITLNDVAITDYRIQSNYIIFPRYIFGELYINYSGGFEVVPDVIKLVTLQIAAKLKANAGMASYTTGVSFPDGASGTFQPAPQDKNYFRGYLCSLDSYRIVHA